MAITNIDFHGRVLATPTAATVLLDGNEIFSGQVGTGQPLDSEIILFSTQQSASNVAVNMAVSISVTSGVMTVGQVLSDGTNGTIDIRNNDMLVNGQAPEWPATPITPMPGGTAQNPDWDGWFFDLSAGESITFTIEVLAPLYVPPGS